MVFCVQLTHFASVSYKVSIDCHYIRNGRKQDYEHLIGSFSAQADIVVLVWVLACVFLVTFEILLDRSIGRNAKICLKVKKYQNFIMIIGLNTSSRHL